MAHKILVVDDEELIRWSLTEDLGASGYKVTGAGGASDAYAALAKEPPDAVITDLRLGRESGLDVLRAARQLYPSVPVILMTGFADLSSAVEALREGAADYISKPLQLAGLKITLERVLETASLRTRLSHAHQKRREKYNLDTVVAASPAMKEAVGLARKIATAPQGTVLIVGESGCGKDRMARAIHYDSARVSQPFMEISCTALSEHLLESELFGYEKGAFTGADKQKKGLFESAEGGTAFLNEIGHMPLSLQAKLLRVLEDKTFKRVGGTEDITVDVRIAAATNENLEKAVAEGRFRSDLYYRINVLTIRLRPLRERREDIPPLIDMILERLGRELGRAKLLLPQATRAALCAYDWPGNVRELRNALERMVILGETSFQAQPTPLRPPPEDAPGKALALPPAGVKLEDLERSMVEQALERSGGNQQKAAALLGISRDALRRRIEKFGLKTAAALALLLVLSAAASAGWFGKDKGAGLDPVAAAQPDKAKELAEAEGAHAPVKDGACSKCHADPKQPKTLAAGDLKTLCFSCHEPQRKALDAKNVHSPFKDGDCSQCHQPHASKNGPLLTDAQASLCTMCHSIEEGAPLKAHNGIKTMTGGCTVCHDPHGSDQPKLLTLGKKHFPFRSKACSMCHADPKDGKTKLKEPLSAACFGCHNDIKEKNQAKQVHGPFGAGDCALCHQPHASSRPALLNSPTQDLCRTCHADVPDVGHPAFGHPTFKRGKADPRRKDKPFDCASCHDPHGAGEPNLMTVKTEGKPMCMACHEENN